MPLARAVLGMQRSLKIAAEQNGELLNSRANLNGRRRYRNRFHKLRIGGPDAKPLGSLPSPGYPE
ncbi:MAG TPA: hypothetical protein VMA09_09345 [Candidatus Binataceae bacterium]|nr:hypothetical protein [Candidatus Binataceae bacterium]